MPTFLSIMYSNSYASSSLEQYAWGKLLHGIISIYYVVLLKKVLLTTIYLTMLDDIWSR